MSQNEIYTILKSKRLSGDDRFFCQAQISKYILEGKISSNLIGSHSAESVGRDLRNLHRWGMLEKYKIDGRDHFRLKKKLLDE